VIFSARETYVGLQLLRLGMVITTPILKENASLIIIHKKLGPKCAMQCSKAAAAAHQCSEPSVRLPNLLSGVLGEAPPQNKHGATRRSVDQKCSNLKEEQQLKWKTEKIGVPTQN
jgi:hypothetical protein